MIISYDAPAVLVEVKHKITGEPRIVKIPTPATFVKPTGGDDETWDYCPTCYQDSIFIAGACHWCGGC